MKTDKYGHVYCRSNKHIRQTNGKPHTVLPQYTPMTIPYNSSSSHTSVPKVESVPSSKIPLTPTSSEQPLAVTPVMNNRPIVNDTPSVHIPTPAKRLKFNPEGKRIRKLTQFYVVRLCKTVSNLAMSLCHTIYCNVTICLLDILCSVLCIYISPCIYIYVDLSLHDHECLLVQYMIL